MYSPSTSSDASTPASGVESPPSSTIPPRSFFAADGLHPISSPWNDADGFTDFDQGLANPFAGPDPVPLTPIPGYGIFPPTLYDGGSFSADYYQQPPVLASPLQDSSFDILQYVMSSPMPTEVPSMAGLEDLMTAPSVLQEMPGKYPSRNLQEGLILIDSC